MQATQILMDEHSVIERVLSALLLPPSASRGEKRCSPRSS
jgi:hemerythrin-like domain-containing protein